MRTTTIVILALLGGGLVAAPVAAAEVAEDTTQDFMTFSTDCVVVDQTDVPPVRYEEC